MRKKESFGTSALSHLVDDLQETLGIKATDNTLEEIDQKVFRAVEKEDQTAMNWLTCQFAHLIMSIAYRRCFVKRDPHTAKHVPYIFDKVNDEDRQDLVNELFSIFPTLVKVFNWNCTFNYYINNKLEWAAINFWLAVNERAKHEITTLDAKVSELSATEEEELTYAQRTSEDQGISSSNVSPREVAEGNLLEIRCDTYARNNFSDKKYKAYYYRIRLGWPMQKVANKLGYKHHSAISPIVREIKEELQSFLSKTSEEYDEIFERINPHLRRNKNEKSEIITISLKFDFNQSPDIPKIPLFMRKDNIQCEECTENILIDTNESSSDDNLPSVLPVSNQENDLPKEDLRFYSV